MIETKSSNDTERKGKREMDRMYVVITSYQVERERIEAALPAHSEWVARSYAEGRILVSGRRHPPKGGLLVVRAESPEEVETWLAGDPLVRDGLVASEIHGFDATEAPKRSAAFDLFLDGGATA